MTIQLVLWDNALEEFIFTPTKYRRGATGGIILYTTLETSTQQRIISLHTGQPRKKKKKGSKFWFFSHTPVRHLSFFVNVWIFDWYFMLDLLYFPDPLQKNYFTKCSSACILTIHFAQNVPEMFIQNNMQPLFYISHICQDSVTMSNYQYFIMYSGQKF